MMEAFIPGHKTCVYIYIFLHENVKHTDLFKFAAFFFFLVNYFFKVPILKHISLILNDAIYLGGIYKERA